MFQSFLERLFWSFGPLIVMALFGAVAAALMLRLYYCLRRKRIVICGSMNFARDMLALKNHFEQEGYGGYRCVVSEGTEEYASGKRVTNSESSRGKIERDLIRKHWHEIQRCDAILVVNNLKNDIEGYIGGNTLLEMGFAHILRKPIFLLNPPPHNPLFWQEIGAMQPVILNNNLGLMRQHL